MSSDNKSINIPSNIHPTYEGIIRSFLPLLREKNPGLAISMHTSFDDFSKVYENGKIVASKYGQQNFPGLIIQVDGDFDLPFEEYDEHELICTSWRNNGYGGMSDLIDRQYRETLPSDFDVVSIQGCPLEEKPTNVARLDLYVIGGCANKISREKTARPNGL